MTVVWVVILFGTVTWAYVMLARHLKPPTPPPTTPAKCQHQQTQQIGMWAWECGCGEVFEVEPS